MKKSIFVEIVRLLIVLVLMAAGHALGVRHDATVFGSALGASIGYIAGGVFGRFVRKAMGDVEVMTARHSASELLAGTIGALLLGLLASLLAAPAVGLLPHPWGWPVFCLVVWTKISR